MIDFHLHTTVSDGVWSPEHLLAYVAASEISVFSITDHDTIDAYPVPSYLSGRVIPGLEVDTVHDGSTVHLLVYGMSLQNSPLIERLHTQRRARIDRMNDMLECLNRLGIPVTIDDVRAHAPNARSLGRPHLARALMSLGVVQSINEAFERYLAEDGPGFVPLARFRTADAIALAHESCAVAVIAHPKRLARSGMIDELRLAGADGIEVIHPSVNCNEQSQYRAYAERYDMLVTGGSDFHRPEGVVPGVHLARRDVERLREEVWALNANTDSTFSSQSYEFRPSVAGPRSEA
jgi:predicted metal-dependent phosphoesterase TrpH